MKRKLQKHVEKEINEAIKSLDDIEEGKPNKK